MAPATKRRKTQLVRFHCQSCMTDRVASQFPEYNPTEQCEHLINTCTQCLKKWVEAQIDTKVFDPRIQCPECEEKMDSGDVRMALPKKAFARYVFGDGLSWLILVWRRVSRGSGCVFANLFFL